MTETQPTPDSSIQTPEEIMDTDFHAVHARLYIAATDDGANLEKIFKPDAKIDIPDHQPSETFINEDQNYNGITWGMSKKERIASWEGVEYDEAMKKWKEGVYTSIHNTSHDKLVEGFFGKPKSDIQEDEDIQKLYDTYCQGESNVTAFARKALDIGATEDETKWLARKLFGKDTADVVVEIMELEKSIRVNEMATFETLFEGDDKEKRINEPNDREKAMFKNIFDGYSELTNAEKEKIKSAQVTQPETAAPLSAPEEPENETPSDGRVYSSWEEKVKAYDDAIEALKNNEIPIDPATGKPLETSSSQEEDIRKLEKRRDDIKNFHESKESTSPPANPDEQSNPAWPAEGTYQVGRESSLDKDPASEIEEETSDLLSAVNQRLEKTQGDEASYEVKPEQLVDYLKTLPLPERVKGITQSDVRIDNNQLEIDITLDTDGGKINISATLVNNPDTGIRVSKHKERIPRRIKMFAGDAVKNIDQYAANIDSVLKNVLDQNINQDWQTNSFYITETMLGVNFARKNIQSQPPGSAPPGNETDDGPNSAEDKDTDQPDPVVEAPKEGGAEKK